MNRFFAEPIDGVATLSMADTHHLKRVLRAKVGDAVEIAHEGTAYTGEIVSLEPAVTVRISGTASAGEPPLEIRLYQAFAKGDKMDWIVQKTVELGVTSIHPFFSVFTDVKLNAERAEKKREHLQQVAVAAAKQCKRSRIPTVHSPLKIQEAIAEAADTHILFCYEKAEYPLDKMTAKGPISVFIGPEGGFSFEEVNHFEEAGAQTVSLGPRILRTETAGMAMLAILQYQWGDMR